jgi:hypothetical protein
MDQRIGCSPARVELDARCTGTDTRGGRGSDLERIQAVGRFVQGIHYISIQTGLGRGGGYKPRPAVEVLQRGYGDCKDKANLMCALLRELGITAWLTLVYLGDRDYVSESWPTPQQFNHCIVAVPIKDSTRAPGVADYPGFGRLLFADPTDSETPVGELPVPEQGSLALVAAGDRGELLRLPTTDPGWDRLERRIEGALLGDGSVSVSIREETRGGAATTERRIQRQLDARGLEGMLGAWLRSSMPGAIVSGVRAVDEPGSGRLSLEMSVAAPGYAQDLPGGLMALRPVLVSRREGLLPDDPSRRAPIMFRREQTAETLRLRLPPGLVADDLPPDTHLETDFGAYASRCGVGADTLRFERRLTLRDGVIPAGRYQEVREFLLKMRAAEQRLVVLRRAS